MSSSSTVSTKRTSRPSGAQLRPATTPSTARLSASSRKQSSSSLKIKSTISSDALPLPVTSVVSQPEPSHNTISYLPSTVTTRSPRYRQSQAPQDNKKFFYANDQTKGSPSDTPTPHRSRVPSRSSNLLSSSAPSTSTNTLRTRSSIATLKPRSSSPSGFSTSTNLLGSHILPHAPSKFVYANGEEEVLSPRRPTLSTAGSTTSTGSVYTPPTHFHPASPTQSSSSQSSALSVGDAPGLLTAADDGETTPGAPAETDAARTNRKILDLEISNTSLLAINHTLEREMRGQSRELRVLKKWIQRHNFGGREIDIGSLSVSETEDSGVDEDSDDESDGSGDEDDEDLTIGPFSAQRSSARNNDSVTRSVMELENVVKKERDLLEASRALNGSITKCIFMSDLLLKEARTSLSFKVSQEDLRIGGRVLSYDDTNYTYDDEEDMTSGDKVNNIEEHDDMSDVANGDDVATVADYR
ncbi:hypothetical protein POJ06DRAFT_7657 [Lipomyces tetrasporus]|uniref:Uncharacterized protein n=1 Tax=Lipomyces tetrasporus TaxID=54092 RepID=A0AAD7QZ27_9ASCO|nr:uncharacterized protein POJ06DRAFT_7657 [Lipomyces tetrasporus]KAJ8103818.1 hypothetical protein POJ06DRAFT_7657 [Lipomyces tetrasporus]